ncbi:hypothetical protein ES677_01060 [Bizionia gelidisalsuginis]|uniref:Uncharacterized protein n=2 Tax=Bizionia TaxID=283785 RepID=A0A8H2QFZ6_9FLAO|nr:MULTISPECIES: hypothetical protein [Bizionia]TYB77322.1 hypothetical protein ES676_03250 [Bizionia saleffrena]TYC17996.1 hypothetical protein ES677_01060 [Bizionia gelidisalsuginis]
METEHNEVPQKKKNIWDLISGIAFIGLGGYRFYSHFLTEATLSNLRLVFAAAFLGFGIYNLYKYTK